jgi:hypothetical protein
MKIKWGERKTFPFFFYFGLFYTRLSVIVILKHILKLSQCLDFVNKQIDYKMWVTIICITLQHILNTFMRLVSYSGSKEESYISAAKIPLASWGIDLN